MSYSLVSSGSNFQLDNVLRTGTGTLSMVEQSMNDFITEVEQDPNISPAETLVMQAQLETWSALVGMYSAITKTYTDTAQQVISNMA
jgi:hypothetical protein